MQKLGLKFLCILFFLFFSIFIIGNASHASKSWFLQTALSESSNPSGVSFVNTLEGYVACDSLYKTTNGGATWSQLPSISGVVSVFGAAYSGGSLFALCEIAGQDTAVYVSTNSGQSFTLLTSEGFGGMNDAYFANANYGVITGNHASGSVNQTTNAGTSWFFGTVEAGDQITDRVRGTATNNIWATYNGGVIKWNGTSWEGISIEDGYTSLPTGIYPLSASTVWAVGSSGTGSTIYKTTNGGNTWTPTTIESTTLYDIWFISSAEGWVAGAGDVNESVVYHTTNGGTTWTKQFGSNGTNQILSLYFTDSNNGWAISSSGRIFKYTNAPEFTTLSPTSGATGSTVEVTITGTNFQATPTISLESGITVNSVTYTSSTEIKANISIASNATPGTRSLTITNPDFGSTTEAAEFTVTSIPPIISSISPTGGQLGATMGVRITGSNFQATPTVTFESGVTVNSVTYVSSTTIEANITISDTTTPGTRNITVTNPDLSSSTEASAFTIVSPPANTPTITLINPAQGYTGTTLGVTITGTNFQDTPTVSFGSGVTVNSVTFNSSTTIEANITIASSATTGAHTVSVTNPDLGNTSEASGFTVVLTTEAPMAISSVVPSSFQQGQSGQVTINGTNFISAESGGTLEVNMGQGINILGGSIFGSYDRIIPQGIQVLSASWLSSTQIVATISVEGTATVGGRDVSVTVRNAAGQTTGYAIKRQGFAVTAAGSQMTSNDVLSRLSTRTWNPDTQGDLTLQIKSPVAGSSDIVIYTPSGPKFKKVQNLSIGYNKVVVPSNLSWPDGVHPVIVTINGQKVISRIVVRK